ncbi:helix-turn-helix transcriptional regulator [Kiritimatiella glycovorans]|uniref:AraC family transcriptional regulator n=1 Tax=Kiritimatiella glycovorans TaxID=1307763 RepID=A0A0G3EGX3_9BACT|nr:AraC family transcriptional regulator [Kiritimatiella glycovorans]AKJ64672.1 AraC family transcriptional regulator [Kiritimatiella glycovorans]
MDVSSNLWATLAEEGCRVSLPINEFEGYGIDSGLVVPQNLLLFVRTPRLRPADRKAVAHHRFVLMIVLKTPATVMVNEHSLYLPEGGALLIHPHQPHYYLIPRDPLAWMFITFDLPQPAYGPLRNRPVALGEAEAIQIRTLFDLYARRGVGSCALCTAALLRQMEFKTRGGPPPVRDDNDPRTRICQKINSYIYDHLDEPFSIDDLARDLGYSPSHLRLVFRESIHLPLGTFIRQTRIHHAQALLRESALSIKEIGFACGFSSPSAFCRSFQREVGVSPRAFRQRQRK